jgi:Acetyltransferase (GNAT) domain
MNLSRTLLDRLPGVAEWSFPCPGAGVIPMQTHAWMQARAASLLQPRDLRLYAVKDGRRIEALAPLLRIGGWLREPPLLHEPADLLWRAPEGLRELASMLAAQSLPVFLERVPIDSPTLPALRQAYAGRGLVQIRPAMPTPVIELGACWQDFDACLKAGRRSDLRRAARRALACGAVGYEIHAPASDAELAALLAEAYAVESRSWKEQVGTSLTADAWQGEFFRRFALEAMSSGILRIAFLRIGGQAVAMQIAAEWQRRFWLFKISYDQVFCRCSPGQLLMLHTLRHAARGGLLSYEFMGVMDDWVTLWTRQTRRYVQVRAIPFNATTGKMLIKRGARSLLGSLRRLAG